MSHTRDTIKIHTTVQLLYKPINEIEVSMPSTFKELRSITVNKKPTKSIIFSQKRLQLTPHQYPPLYIFKCNKVMGTIRPIPPPNSSSSTKRALVLFSYFPRLLIFFFFFIKKGQTHKHLREILINSSIWILVCT